MSKFQNLPKGMLEQLHALQQQLVSAQMELDGEMITGVAADGAVEVTLGPDQKCVRVRIDPELLTPGSADQLGALLAAAFNQALDTSRDILEDRLNPFSPEKSG
jgi:DNA-binding protein YbaB